MKRMLLVLAVMFAVACGGGGDSGSSAPTTHVTENTSPPLRPGYSFSVVDQVGAPVVAITLAPDGSGATTGSLAPGLAAGPLAGGKRRWTSDGRPVASADRSDSGKVKLKDASGTTLWTVKVSSPEKTKVEEGEDTERYELRPDPAAAGEAKVKLGDEDIGKVKSKGTAETKIEGPDGTTRYVADVKPVPGFGVILMDRIPAQLRAILLVELVDRARG